MPASGTTIDSIEIRSDAVGLDLGPHYGSIVINSTMDPNTPFSMPVVLWIYTFGDADGNGMLNISDVVYIINYIFNGGPSPIPLPITGDVNCDRETNISDAVFMINYIFNNGPEPCLF